MLAEGRYRFGALANQLTDNPWVSGWWRYRIPGRGEIDWTEFVASLNAVGYDGVLSIEHEDPELEGTEDKVKQGLAIGLAHLQECRAEASSPQPA
jgi:sugar phosphate isomerase/epimerase